MMLRGRGPADDPAAEGIEDDGEIDELLEQTRAAPAPRASIVLRDLALTANRPFIAVGCSLRQ